MSFYTGNQDKQSGDGLAITEWNDLSNAVAGKSGLTLALNPEDKVGIGTETPEDKLAVNGTLSITDKTTIKGNVGIGTLEPGAPLSIATAVGKESDPDGTMHITNSCILFGGENKAGKELNSAQISAGKHQSNSLNILGMSSNESSSTRRIDAWAEDGFKIRGMLSVTSGGKESRPDGTMHITNGCILFGGNNNTRQATDSAQISAGKHEANSLNIIGMSSNQSPSTRRIDAWAEGGFKIHGTLSATNFIGDGSQLTNLSVGATGLNLATEDDSKVGIGTSNPRQKLEVADGNVVISEGNVGIGTPEPGAPLSIATADGKESDPDGTMHITNSCILFGGENKAGKELNSAQISAGKHQSNSLNILGMSSNESSSTRRIDAWAEDGFKIRGMLSVTSGGKESSPDGTMHITNGCILFGGENKAGKESNSAQISAGKHEANSLNIIGMSSNQSPNTRRIDAWAEGGFKIHGASDNVFTITTTTEGLVFKIKRAERGGRQIVWDGDTNWDANSDQKLKTDIENETNILKRLMKLDVKNFLWKDEPKRKNKLIGFLAQDVKPWFPSLVGKMEDLETKEATLTLKYANFGVLAVGAIKELKLEYDKRIAAFEKEIADLKTKLDAPTG